MSCDFEKAIWQSQIVKKVQDDKFAKGLYASLCNTPWMNKKTGDIYTCSWRYAGDFIARLRNKDEDYMDFYCSGREGTFNRQVYKELNKIGYKAITYKKLERIEKIIDDAKKILGG